MHGYGRICGPFVATEIARVLERLNKTLVTLDISYNSIGDEGASAFALALRTSNLTALDLSGNGITSIGAAAILDAFKNRDTCSPPFQQLELAHNPIDPELVLAIQGEILLSKLPRIIEEQVASYEHGLHYAL